jgi:rubrerythrin
MKNGLEVGFNRSGIATAPRLAPQALEVQHLTPRTSGDASALSKERLIYAKSAEPVATMPPPGTMKELAATTVKLLKGEKVIVFSDKVGERMGFERGSVRLYEALLSKLDAFGSWERGPERAELEDILQEELEHFHLLADVMKALGGDPTAVTPSAEVHSVLATGLRAVIVDPRMNLRQSLEAILIAELADNDCWQNLVRLAHAHGDPRLAERFQRCLEQERMHLSRVRTWITAGLSSDAFGDAHKMLIAEPWVQQHGGATPQARLQGTAPRIASGNDHRRSRTASKGNGHEKPGKRNGNGVRKHR